MMMNSSKGTEDTKDEFASLTGVVGNVTSTPAFRKLPIVSRRPLSGAQTETNPETLELGLFWRKFKTSTLLKEYASVNSIAFHGTQSPALFSIGASPRVQTYSAKSKQIIKTINKFTDVVQATAVRADGKIIAAGDHSGVIQLLDANSRTILRTLKAHTKPIQAVLFLAENGKLVSASDDGLIIVWDIPSETPSLTLQGHTDYVKTLSYHPSSPNLLVSGGYDHTVRLWDLTTGECKGTVDHEHPVESVLLLPRSNLVVSAGSNIIKVWDILSGNRCLTTFSNHQKTITCLAVDSACRMLISGSLDGLVKVYDLVRYGVVHSFKYPAPILSMALAPNDAYLVVGMSNGSLSVRERIQSSQQESSTANMDLSSLVLGMKRMPAHKTVRGGSAAFRNRGAEYIPDESDIRIERNRLRKLQPYDMKLKAFKYAEALDAALREPVDPNVVVALLEELAHRSGLSIAIANRSEKALLPLLNFLARYSMHPLYASLLLDVGRVVFDTYGTGVYHCKGASDLEEAVDKLKFRVDREFKTIQGCSEVLGLLDAIFAASY